MLKNKIIVKKIRNIVILLMVLIIMIGLYTNIRRSRAENVIELDAIAIDSYGYIEDELFKFEALEIGNNQYEIKMPESINGKKVNRIEKVTLDEIRPEITSKNGVKENATTENTVVENSQKDTINENTEEQKQEKIDSSTALKNPVEENIVDENESKEEKNVTEEIKKEEATTKENGEIDITPNIIDNKIILTKEQIENKQVNIKVIYDVAILETNEKGEYNKNLLVEKSEEERKKIKITEETEMLYSKILKYEDEKNGKLVEIKGYLPKDAELKIEEVSEEQLKEIFGEAKIDVAYDIKIVIHKVKEVLVDETDPTKGKKEVIETIEINPEELGETCEVLIKDVEIQENSQVYHVKDDNTYEQVNVTESVDENISFEATSFSIYAVSVDETLMKVASDVSDSELDLNSETDTSTTAPIITFESESDSNWERDRSVKVTLADENGLALGASVKYGWSESNTTQPTTWKNATITSYLSGAQSTTFYATATEESESGKHYLWVKPVTLKDLTGNSRTEIEISNGTFWNDNESPKYVFSSTSSAVYVKNFSETVTYSDLHSGLDFDGTDQRI